MTLTDSIGKKSEEIVQLEPNDFFFDWMEKERERERWKERRKEKYFFVVMTHKVTF